VPVMVTNFCRSWTLSHLMTRGRSNRSSSKTVHPIPFGGWGCL
jgi:hypothetical protein